MNNGVSRCELMVRPVSSLVISGNAKIVDNSNDAIDIYEYKTSDGKTKYISEEEYNKNLEMDMKELDELITKMNIFSRELEKGTLNFECDDFLEDNDNDKEPVVTINSDSILENSSNKKHSCKEKIYGIKMRLIRTAVIAGVALGLTAATKSSLNLGTVNYNSYSTSIETGTETVTNNIQELMKNTLKSKHAKKNKDKLGSIKLRNTKLSYTSMNENPSVNTKQLRCDSYKAHYAAILDDSNNLIDVIDVSKKQGLSVNKFKKNCKKVYGNNINIQINVDGIIDGKVVYKQAGWVPIEKSVNCNQYKKAQAVKVKNTKNN